MHGVSVNTENRAISACDTSVAKTDISVVDDENWFKSAVKSLLPDKPGTALDCITEFRFGERNCQRYAAGTVTASMHFLRALLRSKQGRTFLGATMDGCDVEWWRDMQRAERIADAVGRVE